MKAIVVALAALAVAGCESTWERIGDAPVTGPGKAYQVSLPPGWVRFLAASDAVLVTRDGFGLQRVLITRKPNEKAFEKIKKAASDDMLPAELAELQIAEFKAEGDQLANVQVLENAPATVSGRPGFRLHLRYKNQRGLPIDTVVYGLTHDKHYYRIFFQAPGIHYFEKHKPDLEQVVSSFKLM